MGIVRKGKVSGVIKLLDCVWNHTNEGKNHSWLILNQSMRGALEIAITSGFKFALKDFQIMHESYDIGYWFGTNADGNGIGQRLYALAIEHSNMSACQSFEQWQGYDPYLFLGDRLGVGSELPWHLKQEWEAFFERTPTASIQDYRDANWHGSDRWFVTGYDAYEIRIANYFRDANPHGRQEGRPKRLKKLNRELLSDRSSAIRAVQRQALKSTQKDEAA